MILLKFLYSLVHFFKLILPCVLFGRLSLFFLVLKVLTVRIVLLEHLKLALVLALRSLSLLGAELLHKDDQTKSVNKVELVLLLTKHALFLCLLLLHLFALSLELFDTILD